MLLPSMSSLPAPHADAGPFVVSASVRAVPVRQAITAARLSDGLTSSMAAIAPLTWAAAIDVPVALACLAVERLAAAHVVTGLPGAAMRETGLPSRPGPRLDNAAIGPIAGLIL